MGDQTEEPAQKRGSTDFALCLLCQSETNDKLVDTQYRSFNNSAYVTILDCIHRKARYGNPDYISASHRLSHINAEELENRRASWHRNCYKTAVSHLERAEKRSVLATTTLDTTVLTTRKRGRPPSATLSSSSVPTCSKLVTRQQTPVYDKNKCIFCQPELSDPEPVEKENEKLYNCCTTNKGQEIQDIVNKSGKSVWPVGLADVLSSGDLLSRDVMYHNSCRTKNWEKYIQRPRRRSKSLDAVSEATRTGDQHSGIALIAAEVQFFSIIQEKADAELYIKISEAEDIFQETLLESGIVNVTLPREALKKKIKGNVANIKITPSYVKKPSYIHSTDAAKSAINAAADSQEHNTHGTLTLLLQCAKYLRSVIQNTRKDAPWCFTGSLENCASVGVPEQLLIFIRWMLQGTNRPTQSAESEDDVKRSANLISQHILQKIRSDRQVSYIPISTASSVRSTYETPPAVGLSLYAYHKHRSKNDLNLLDAATVGIPYHRVNEITTQICNSVVDRMNKYDGVYVPPGVVKGTPIRASSDNIDSKVDTPDGRDSFHGTAISVYQRVNWDSVPQKHCDVLPLTNTYTRLPKNVPPTIQQMEPCSIIGSPRPSNSPQYEHYRLGQHSGEVRKAQALDQMWLLSRYLLRPRQADSSDTIVEDTDPLLVTDSVPLQSDIEPAVSSSSYGDSSSEMPSVEDTSDCTQSVPVWRAYNSLLSDCDKSPIDNSHSLPIINAPAHEWPTLVTVLETLNKLNKFINPNNPGKVMVTFDIDLYKRALKLEYLDEKYCGKWWLLPGSFHTSLCTIRCLDRTIENSGIDEVWVRSGLYSAVVVTQIINGSHYNRAVEAHEITLQALTDLWLDEFFLENHIVRETLASCVLKFGEAFNISDDIARKIAIADAHKELLIQTEAMNLEVQLCNFDNSRAEFPMYSWVKMYMRQVHTMLAFHRSVKQPQLLLYLASLEKLCTYFFAYNRLDYAQNILEFVARAYASKEVEPDIWERLLGGEFAITKNDVAFTSIGTDQAQEHMNKILKGEGGLCGITNKPATLLKYCLTAPVLGQLSTETQEMFGMNRAAMNHRHHQDSRAKVMRQENNVKTLKAIIQPHRLFSEGSKQLHNFMTKQVLREEAQASILNMVTRGEEAKKEFLEKRICGKVNLWDRLAKVKLLNWDDLCKKTTLKTQTKEFQLRSMASLFSRLLVIAKSHRSLDLQATISDYEFHNVNQTLLRPDGTLLPCTGKSDLVKSMLEVTSQDEIPNTNSDNRYLIIDGMAAVQILVHSNSFKVCKDFGQAFPIFIDSLLQTYKGGRVVFDNYNKQITIKDDIRYSGNAGYVQDVYVEDNTPITDTKEFLASKTTKDRHTLYLADKLIRFCKSHVVTVTRRDVLSNIPDYSPTTGVSTQEEADTLMLPHALEIVNEEIGNEVDFYTKDTDCWVLIVRRLPQLRPNTRIITGTGRNQKQIRLQPIYDKLGKERAAALHGFHAVTGSDTTGHISGIGKKTVFKTFMTAPPRIIGALSQLGIGDVPSPETVERCEEFYCMMLSTKAVSASDAATLRWKKFKQLSGTQGIEKLPPTSAAWKHHTFRAHLQANLWIQDTVLNPRIPDPCKLGWIKGDSCFVPVLSDIQAAPKAVVELIRCNCTVSRCVGRCSCRSNNLECTELCACEASEDCCNSNVLIDEEDE